jgi:AraC-like DNA-binding protein
MFFMIPRQVYLVETARNISGITVTFPPEMLTNEEMISPVIQNLSDNNQINLSNQEYNYLDHLLSAMLKEYGDKEMFSQALLKNYLNNLLLYSGRVYARQNRLQQAAGDNNEMIKKFIRLLSLNWNRSMNVSQYARELYITPGHLNHIVKKQTGRKAGDWIKEKKLVEIKRLLIHSRYSIKEIADKSGFEDPAYFNRYFKNNVGETPLSFREEILKKYNS